MATLPLEVAHLSRWESLDQLSQLLQLDQYPRDGLFQVGELAGLSQMIQMESL